MEAGNNLDVTNGEAMKLLTFSLFITISKKVQPFFHTENE
jgi:hypothetical protein